MRRSKDKVVSKEKMEKEGRKHVGKAGRILEGEERKKKKGDL